MQRHHFPANTCTRQVMRDAYVGTSDVYTKMFGEQPHADLWPKAGETCGDSYSGFVSEDEAIELRSSRQAMA